MMKKEFDRLRAVPYIQDMNNAIATNILESRNPHRAMNAHVERHGSAIAQDLYVLAQQYNIDHFNSELAPAFVEITVPSSLRALATYNPKNPEGIESCIRISPSVAAAGLKLAADALLHEMIHAWQQEVNGDLENGYAGHGPKFAAKCNEIGAKLGLGPVSAKGRGEDGKDCAQWPLNVRPEGYYGESKKAETVVTRARQTKAERKRGPRAPKAAPAAEDLSATLARVLHRLSVDQLKAVRHIVDKMIERAESPKMQTFIWPE